MSRFLPSAAVALLLVLVVAPGVADESLSESLRVDWEPAGTLSVRAVTVIGDRLKFAVAGRSGDENQRIRLGVETPLFVAGPLALSGAYRELSSSRAGPRSDAWYARGRVALDASLDSSRRGLVIRPLPALDLFVWKASNLVVGTRLAVGDRTLFAEVLGSVTSLPSMLSIAGTDETATSSWFEDRDPPLPVGNLIARAAGVAEWGAAGSSVSVSLPRSALPGLSLRGTAKISLPGRWVLAGIAFIATTDYRFPGGERPDDPARWGAALRRDGRFVDAGVDFARAYESGDAGYDAIGFASEALVGSNAAANASITIRRRDEMRRVASVGARVRLEFSTAGTASWRTGISSRITPSGGRLEVTPSIALASGYDVSARVRTVYSVSALAFILVGGYEQDSSGKDFDVSFSVRYRV